MADLGSYVGREMVLVDSDGGEHVGRLGRTGHVPFPSFGGRPSWNYHFTTEDGATIDVTAHGNTNRVRVMPMNGDKRTLVMEGYD